MKHTRDTARRPSRMRGLVASAAAVAMGVTGLVVLATSASAVSAATTCDDTTHPNGIVTPAAGWTDKFGDPGTDTFLYEAPDGFLVDMYCVKAGPDALIIPVAPPASSVLVDYPGKDSISHFRIHLVPEPTEEQPPPEEEPPLEEAPPVQEAPPVVTQTLAETGFGLELLALAGSLSLVGGGLLNGRRVLRSRS